AWVLQPCTGFTQRLTRRIVLQTYEAARHANQPWQSLEAFLHVVRPGLLYGRHVVRPGLLYGRHVNSTKAVKGMASSASAETPRDLYSIGMPFISARSMRTRMPSVTPRS